MKKSKIILLALGLAFMALLPSAKAFVLMGPLNPNETGSAWNYTDDLGAPKTIDRQIPRLYRWNNPHFVYSFDASFVNYFGPEGMDSVTEAMGVINDFFVNGDYQGMSELDLAKHGFVGNYNTTWINTTAQNAQVIDLKSIVLGMMVNHLGLGNPHRHAFSIINQTTNSTTNAINFHVALRNYDPTSSQATDFINGVQYSYRLVHDAAIQVGATPPAYTIADMEEFTTDTTGNAWSSVAAVVDAFYGNTQLFWTDTPSQFGFGVYYDGFNAMGGQFQPRHALTYDDAGGLKYLYSKNTLIYESLDTAGGATVIEPAQYLPAHMQTLLANPSGRRFPFLPRAGGALGGALPSTFSSTSPIAGTPGLGGVPIPAGTNIVLRGGIDSIQMYYQPFDSLLGVTFTPTNFVWTDTFLYQPTNNNKIGISDASGNQIGSISASQNGIQWSNPFANKNGMTFWQNPAIDYSFKTQKIGRSVTAPDMLFVADYLPPSADGVPVGFTRDVPVTSNTEMVAGYNGVGMTNETGPGIFNLPAAGATGARFAYTFHKIGGALEGFEVLWSGEVSVVGNQDSVPTLWGHIKGPGPNDVEYFPKGSTQDRVWNSVIPDTSVPGISLVSDSAGVAPIEQNTLTRSEEVLTIIGSEMASVTAIEIMSGDLVFQTIMSVDKYIVSNSRIDIPAGIITDASEGAERQVRVWNSVGASEKGTQKFTIETGRPVITGTSSDNFPFDRAQTLTVYGYGFKSRENNETVVDRIRVDDANSAAVEDTGTGATPGVASTGLPFTVSNIQTISDTQIVLPIDAMTAVSDGSNRRLRVARKAATTAADVDSVLSPATNPLFTAITSKPVVTSLSQFNALSTWELIFDTGMYKRDRVLEINGTALNTVTTIEVTQEDGTSFANPVFIQMPNAAVAVEANGTRIQVSADAIPWSDADNNSSAKRAFKIYNAVGNTDLDSNKTFVVNKQPVVDGIGGFSVAGHFNRDKTLGDDLTIFGSGFMAVKNITFVADNNSSADGNVTIALPAPGITVTDNSIAIDTQTFQFGAGDDTSLDGAQRIIKLVSARDNALSSVAQRFKVGAPPTLTSHGVLDGNYSRDIDAVALVGTGFGHMSLVEIVDVNGNPIAGVPGIFSGTDGTGGTGLDINSTTSASINGNATGWITTAHLMDTTANATRRIKITTPFGSITSTAATAFSMGATPELKDTSASTFAGGGYNGGSNIYDKSDGDLIINGKNFRGADKIVFAGTGGGTFIVDPKNPPAGFTFSTDGTKITVTSAVLPSDWIGTTQTVQVSGIDSRSVTSGTITTQE